MCGVRDVGHRMREFCIYSYDVRVKLEALDGEESSVLWNTDGNHSSRGKIPSTCVKRHLWKQTSKQ